MALFRIGCFLFTILTIESPRAFLSQRYGFESIDFIFFDGTGESAFRCRAELGMSRALLSELVRGTDHGGACLPVLELRLRGVCFGRGVCWDGLVLIRLLRKGLRNGAYLKMGNFARE